VNGSDGRPAPGLGPSLLLAFAFFGAAFFVYAPALDGPFVSDDLHYVATNPYVHGLSGANVAALLDPTGPATVLVVNYSPLQLLVHATVWEIFGDATRAHHVVNVALHALGSLLLVALLGAAGVGHRASILGGALFLLNPANVEAVAWISQLKTSLAMVLSLAALLLWPRRPGASTIAFTLALLAKATAAYALPVAALIDWARQRRVRPAWLGAWTLVLAAYALVEFATHNRTGAAEVLHEDPVVLARSILAFVGRYLAMATTGLGVSAFHEPEPTLSWLDPWWLLGILAVLAIGARTLWALAQRREEAAWWAWAAVSFLPVSQIFPFLHPLADRYLYFILPGLIGGVLLAAPQVGAWLSARSGRPQPSAAAGVALALGAGLALVFAYQSHARAEIWASPARIAADAASHYPDVAAGRCRARIARKRSPR
jgi:hypothetical protein